MPFVMIWVTRSKSEAVVWVTRSKARLGCGSVDRKRGFGVLE